MLPARGQEPETGCLFETDMSDHGRVLRRWRGGQRLRPRVRVIMAVSAMLANEWTNCGCWATTSGGALPRGFVSNHVSAVMKKPLRAAAGPFLSMRPASICDEALGMYKTQLLVTTGWVREDPRERAQPTRWPKMAKENRVGSKPGYLVAWTGNLGSTWACRERRGPNQGQPSGQPGQQRRLASPK